MHESDLNHGQIQSGTKVAKCPRSERNSRPVPGPELYDVGSQEVRHAQGM